MTRTTLLLVASYPFIAGAVVAAESAPPRIRPEAGWIGYSDKVAGGASATQVTKPAVPKDSRGEPPVRVEGALARGFGFPFAGALVYFVPDQVPLDARGFSGVEFSVRGDGRPYLMQVLCKEVTDYNHFARDFTTSAEWTKVQIPFKRLAQTIPGAARKSWTGADVQGVGFQAQGFIGKFWLEVRDIALYR